MENNDGEQAFPSVARGPGMSLRDYFAAAALTGLIHGGHTEFNLTPKTAQVAYEYADAMLAASSGDSNGRK